MKEWKIRSLVIGASLGALIGTAAAYLLVRQAERTNEKPKITASHGVTLGMAVINLLRQFLDLGSGKK